MAKIEFNTLVNEIRGQVDKAVLRKYKGRIIVARKPSNDGKPSAAQVAQRKRFRSAADFGKDVMADATVRPLYERAAAERELPVFAVCIADFFNPPSITSIDALNYTGRAGQPVRITAEDDFGVVRVHVELSDEQGIVIESGDAVQNGNRQWTYTSQQIIDTGTLVQFQVTATDRPGGTAVERTTKRT